MKRLLAIILISTISFTACKQGSLEPIVPASQSNTSLSEKMSGKWKVDVIKEDGVVVSETGDSNKIIFDKNGSVVISGNGECQNGEWVINEQDSTLTITVTDKEDSTEVLTGKIIELNDKKLVYSISRNGKTVVTEYYFENGPLYTIKGALRFKNSTIKISPQTQVAVVWQPIDSKKSAFKIGTGKIDWQNLTYAVEFYEYPFHNALNEVFNSNFDIESRFGVGYVVAYEPTLTITTMQRCMLDGGATLPDKVVGIAQDRALVYVAQAPKVLTSSTKYSWISRFNLGFNVAEGSYNFAPNPDEFIPNSNRNGVDIVIDNDPGICRLPRWVDNR